MGRPSNTQQRRLEIVLSLLKVMAEKGYANATIQAIAKQAELKPGLIHYHFKSKQEILVELVKWVSEQAQARFDVLSEKANTPWEKLKAFVDARLAKGSSENPEAVAAWVVISAEAIRQTEVKTLYEDAIDSQLKTLIQLLTEASDGKLSKNRARDIASITVAAMEGAFTLSVAAGDVMPKNYASNSLLELLKSHIEAK